MYRYRTNLQGTGTGFGDSTLPPEGSNEPGVLDTVAEG